MAAFTEVIELDPENIEAYMGRAEAYKGLKQYNEAKTDYTTAIEKTDELPYTQAKAYAGRAEVDDLTDQTEEAESDYSMAIGLLDAEDTGKKENVAQDLITRLKIKILQLHAEICMKLGLYDKAMADYARLEELGVDMSAETNEAEDSAQQDTSSMGGAYVWTYTDAQGNVTKGLITVQAGSSQLNAVMDFSSDGLDAEGIASMIASYRWQKKYPETWKKLFAMDADHISAEQGMELQTRYSAEFQEFANEVEQLEKINWRPELIEVLALNNPVSRVEKTADTLYIYVPTGTYYKSMTLTFTSYSGRAETIDVTDIVAANSQNDLSKPVYEWTASGDVAGSFKIVYREDR